MRHEAISSIKTSSLSQQFEEVRVLFPVDCPEEVSEVGIYLGPLLLGVGTERFGTVDEVAALSVAAGALPEGLAILGLVGAVLIEVDPQFLGSMGKLAARTVGTVALLGEVRAGPTLGFGGGGPGVVEGEVVVVVVGGSLRFGVAVEGVGKTQQAAHTLYPQLMIIA
jgi:hypothetical protein